MKGGFRLQPDLKSEGFSIIEVLIVLAVTAGLFLSAVFMLSGRQRQAEFSTSIREVQTQMQQTIAEISSGFYPSQENFRCTGSFSGPSIVAASSSQGQNTGCIFLGKVVQFGVQGTSDPEQYAVFSIAGLQQVGGAATNPEVQTLAQAMPRAIAQSAASPTAPNGSVQTRSLRGLRVLWVRNGDTGASVGGVGFVSSLASYTSGVINSGAQVLNLMPVNGTSTGMTNRGMADAINTNLAASPVNPANGVMVCFASNGLNRSGLMTIGSNGRQLSVKMDVKENSTCN